MLPLSENTTVSVITCGNGAEMYSLFGHTAIHITDKQNHIDEVYNYGAFDFNTPNFVLKFIKGDLQYFATNSSYNDFLYEYQYDKRSVDEQVLNLSQVQKQQLFDDLNATLVSEERFYTYKFIDKNCTTMVINIINKTLGKEVIVKTTDKEKTYREILYPYFKDHFYEKLGISIIFGKKVDLKGEQLFLPAELQESIANIQYNKEPICQKNTTILEFKKEKTPISWWNNFYSFSLLLLIVVIVNNNRIYMVYFFLMGLLGLFLTFVGFYSLHKELEYNYNILLFNPALLFLIYFYLKNNRKWMYLIALLALLSIAIYLVIMMNKIHLVIVLPLIITSLIGLVKLAIQNKNQGTAVKP
ncbi:MAG TPA: DUF4105 domain-containing protein [Flavobacterium sp.]|nr:DUF4105 domain-containing protein [Flavobacterium sp.]